MIAKCLFNVQLKYAAKKLNVNIKLGRMPKKRMLPFNGAIKFTES